MRYGSKYSHMTLGTTLHLHSFGITEEWQELAGAGAPFTQRLGAEYSLALGWTLVLRVAHSVCTA